MPRLRIASFNLSGAVASAKRVYGRFPGALRRADRARRGCASVARFFEANPAELIAMQEVDCLPGDPPLGQDQAIARALGQQSEFLPVVDASLGGLVSVRSGLAMSSSLTVESSDVIELTNERRLRLARRRSQVQRYRLGSHLLTVVNVHLCHSDPVTRLAQLDQVLDFCLQNQPAVLIGDLNTTPSVTREDGMLEPELYRHDGCMERLRTTPAVSADPKVVAMMAGGPLLGLATYPAVHPRLKLDYVLVIDQQARFSLAREVVLPMSPEISDHRPLVAELRW